MLLFKTLVCVPGTDVGRSDPHTFYYQFLGGGVGIQGEQGKNIFMLQHLQLNM